MEKNIRTISKEEALMLSPLALAWIGDGVFSNFIRKYLVLNTSYKIKNLHKDSIRFVSAESQNKLLNELIPELTEEEISIIKKGRNATHKAPKSSTIMEYKNATGFESLLGWLELTGQSERINYICDKVIEFT